MTQQHFAGLGVLAFATATALSGVASAAPYYYAGYDATNSVPGTVDSPVTGAFSVAGQNTFYADAAGTVAYGPGVGVAASGATEIYFGGTATTAAYTASGGSGTSQNNIGTLVLNANNPGTNTFNTTYSAAGKGCYQFNTNTTGSGGGPGGAVLTPGIIQNGSANWTFGNSTNANAPLRLASTSAVIGGSGSGNITIPFNFAANGTGSLEVNLTGGASLIFANGTTSPTITNDFGGGNNTSTFTNFTLTAGTVDFQKNTRPFGSAKNQVRLNGGTLLSSTGTTVGEAYTGIGAVGGTAGIVIGGNVTVGGSLAWGLGPSNVTLTGNRTITSTNAAGVTVAGNVGESGGGYGLTLAGPGTLALTGTVGYTGATVVQSGKLVLAPAAQTGTGGIDIRGGAAVLNYTGTSNIETIRGQLSTAFVAGSGVLTGGQLRSSLATTKRGLGYSDDGVGATTIKSTLFGDADLDGGVSINDFNALAGNFGQSSGKHWTDGDFDYDGGVSINDFNLLAGSFGQTLPAGSDAWAGLLAFAAAQDDVAAFAAVTGVPEPTSVGIVAVGLTLGLRRRRRSVV